MRRTPLYDRHVALGARLVPFAGWEMPLHYPGGILAEHRAVRAAAGLFDVSHMGELAVRGPGAGAAVGWLCANDPSGLGAGQALYTPLCAADGGTVDDAILYCRRPGEDYLFVVNAGNVAGDHSWMRAELEGRAGWAIADESAETALLALQGPRAAEVLARAAPAAADRLRGLPPFRFAAAEVAGVSSVCARTGYTGEDGFELACASADAGRLWDGVLAAGDALGLRPCGLGARDTLRLEAALPLYGHELSPSISPLEARLRRFVKVQGRQCCGAAALRQMAQAGPPRRLIGLYPQPPAIARPDAAVADVQGQSIGVVTSGTFAPTLRRAVALALVRAGTVPGAGLTVSVRGRAVPAEAVRLPFYRRPAAGGTEG